MVKYPFSILILSKKEAEQYEPTSSKEICISISSPDENYYPTLSNRFFDILYLKFDDETDTNLIVKPHPRGLKLFSKKDAVRILRYVSEYAPVTTKLVIHCEAGLSRSAAVAIAISDLFKDREYSNKLIKEKPLYNRFVTKLLLSTYYKINEQGEKLDV